MCCRSLIDMLPVRVTRQGALTPDLFPTHAASRRESDRAVVSEGISQEMSLNEVLGMTGLRAAQFELGRRDDRYLLKRWDELEDGEQFVGVGDDGCTRDSGLP